MEINGLPLHPLVVHAAVVFGPIAALTALFYVSVPSWRDRARWPMVALALVATAAILAAFLTGRDLLSNRPELEQLASVTTHRARGTRLLWVTGAFGVVAVATGWWHAREGAVRLVLNLLLAVGAVAVLVLVVLTGDSGSRAVWGR